MKAADVMVTNVITVGPDACVQDVARILLDSRISGVPVVGSDGKLLGMVSEGDLMRRVEAGTGRRRPWWLAIFTGRETLASEFVKEHSRRVTDVMNSKRGDRDVRYSAFDHRESAGEECHQAGAHRG